MDSTEAAPIEEIIERIAYLNQELARFWSDGSGWAPKEAAELLSKSRLDWQVSLSRALVKWISPPNSDELAATQILGYANLGALVEGTLQLFLSVYYNDYKSDADAILKDKKVQSPDVVTLESLRVFFSKKIWISHPDDEWDPWIQRTQRRRVTG